MILIWRDRMDMLGIHDTGALRSSVEKGKFSMEEDSGAMAFHYLEYGIYVDLGTGNGYYRGNPGDLHFLDPTYRLEHKLGAPRKRRPWFNKSWYISVMVLKEKLADVIGEQFSGLFDNLEGRERG
jgi:hypothetical protein